jgi:hypothetical protein
MKNMLTVITIWYIIKIYKGVTMETAVIMKRKLFDCDISQNSKNEFFSATDLVKSGNKWRVTKGLDIFNLNNYFLNKSTKDFLKALEKKYGKIKINSTGKNRHTWVHPYLFLDLALAINPELKIEVYSWLYDYLIKYRNDSGDSYKKMCGALYENQTNKSLFGEFIKETANKIKLACDVIDWQEANEDKLKMRDRIHENIALLTDVLKNNSEAVRLGILKTMECNNVKNK